MAQSRISSHTVDNAMALARAREDKHNALTQFTLDQQKLAHGAKAEIDIGSRRRAEMTKKLMAEEMMQKTIDEGERNARLEMRAATQNEHLARELERRRLERERKEREIQRICEESEELKDLERHLKVAYMNKERAAQHEERVVLERMEREQDQAMQDAMEVDRQYMVAAEMEKAKARRLVGLEQKGVLQEQIRVRQVLLEQAKEEAARDKSMVDEVVAKIEAEDARDRALKEKRQRETKAVIKAYEVQRREEKAAAARAAADAEAEIKRHMESVAAREAGMAEARDAKEAAAAAAFAAIAEENERVRREEEEMGALRDMLWEEEMEAKRRGEDEARAAARASSKAEMALANQQMLEAKAKKRAEDAEEEGRLVQLMMAKFAQDEANERAGEEQRRAARERYQSEIAAAKAMRHEAYQAEKEAELEELGRHQDDEGYRKAVVAEARRRLLEEHAKRLDGFLPKGALQNADEHKVFFRATGGGMGTMRPGETFGRGTQGAEGYSY